MKKVFLSYSYSDKKIVNEVEYILQKENIQILDEIKLADNIKYKSESYINDADCAIILISDSYLRSEMCIYEGALILQNKFLRDKCFMIVANEIDELKLLDNEVYVKYWLDREKAINDDIGLAILKDEDVNYAGVENVRRTKDNINILLQYLLTHTYIKYNEFKKNQFYYVNKLIENTTNSTSSKYYNENIDTILVQAKKIVDNSTQKSKHKLGRNSEYTEIEKSLAYKCFISWTLTKKGKLNMIFKHNTLLEYCIEFTVNVLAIYDIKKKIKAKIQYYEPEYEVILWKNEKTKMHWCNLTTGAIASICEILNDLNEKSPNMIFNRNIISEMGIDVYGTIASNWIAKTIGESVSELIDEKLKANGSIIEYSHRMVLPGYSLDDSSGEDKLNIMKDVNALATLISYRNLNPPLAIGIFGKWGSGKSFFMDKLKFKIEELSEQKNNFCNDIVHVKFNAWHYSDTSLWASLVEKIFNELTRYAKIKGKEKEATQILFEELESSKNAIFEIQNNLNNINCLKEELLLKKSKAENERSENDRKLDKINFGDINYIVKNDEDIKNDINELKTKFDDLDIETVSDIRININNIDSFIKQSIYVIKILRKKSKKEFIIFILIGLGIPTVFFIINKVFITNISDINKKILELLALIFSITASWKIKLSPIIKTIKSGYERLIKLEESWKLVTEKKRYELSKEEEELTINIKKIEQEKNELNDKLAELENRKCELNIQIDEIKSGKKLVQFLEQVSTNEKYRKQCGIISTVRNDFEQLTKLIMRSNRTLEQDSESENSGFKIDRIVLYIDDLDRCNNKKVMEVLEAVHLLLAFKLFVVIVGVDPRWISSALATEYKNLGNPFEESMHTNNSASTFDYLDKIFQIPFTLKELEENHSKRLVEYLFNQQIDLEETALELDIDVRDDKKESFEEIIDNNNINENININSIINKEIEIKELKISVDELEFMKVLSPIVANTPREVKKFVNIYRIIRIHEDMPIYEKNKLADFKAVMLLLVLITCESNESFNLLDAIMKDNDKTKTKLLDLELEKSINKDNNNKILKEICELIKSNIEVREIEVEKLKQYAPLVSKFSFKANW